MHALSELFNNIKVSCKRAATQCGVTLHLTKYDTAFKFQLLRMITGNSEKDCKSWWNTFCVRTDLETFRTAPQINIKDYSVWLNSSCPVAIALLKEPECGK